MIAEPMMPTRELCRKAGIDRGRLARLRKDNPDLRPVSVSTTFSMWPASVVDRVIKLVSQQDGRRLRTA